ncbi:MAG: hypothetical protein ACJ74O_02755 [Frankiaceae bacterium]
MKFVEGHPATNVQIAHIHGAKPGSARYDPSMTDAERASFNNLVLLCKPHHDLIDRIAPADYPPDSIRQWKRDREGNTTAVLSEVAGWTDARLAKWLESAVRQIAPQREVTVELGAGVIVDNNGLAHGPLGGWDALLEANPHLASNLLVLVTRVRNTGSMPVSLESIALHYEVAEPEGAEATMMGENRLPQLNPVLPRRLDVGESCRWLTPRESFAWVRDRISSPANRIVALRASATLGTGETVYSPRYPLEGGHL